MSSGSRARAVVVEAAEAVNGAKEATKKFNSILDAQLKCICNHVPLHYKTTSTMTMMVVAVVAVVALTYQGKGMTLTSSAELDLPQRQL